MPSHCHARGATCSGTHWREASRPTIRLATQDKHAARGPGHMGVQWLWSKQGGGRRGPHGPPHPECLTSKLTHKVTGLLGPPEAE